MRSALLLGLALVACTGATAYPSWTGTVFLPRNATVQYKFIKKNGGNVTWEAGGNRTFTVPNAAAASAGGAWQ